MKDITEYLEKQLNNTNYWLSFAEAKNAALVALNITLIVMIATMEVMSITAKIVFAIIFIASSVICLASFLPNMTNKPKKVGKYKDDMNLLFYGDIAKIDDANAFIEAIRCKYFSGVSVEEAKSKINIDYAKEILINSEITVRKYNLFKVSLGIDVLTFIGAIIFLIIA